MNYFATAVFCDDIRDELSNKFSLMGVYDHSIQLFQQPPLLFAKMGVYVRLFMPFDARPKRISIKVFMPQDKDNASIYDDTVLGDPPQFPSKDIEAVDSGTAKGQLLFAKRVMVSPVVFETTGLLRCQVWADNILTEATPLPVEWRGEQASNHQI